MGHRAKSIERFPKDFMFELTKEEMDNLRCKIGTSSWGGIRYVSMAFTEHGVLMLSSVLNSSQAIKVNIQIMRIFISIREMMLTNKDILLQLDQVQQKLIHHDNNILLIFEYIRQLEQEKQKVAEHQNRKRIGYKRENNK